METDRLKAEGLKLDGFIRGSSTAWWPEGPADMVCMVWYVWYGMVWYGMVWYGMVCTVWYGIVW